jgi:hypothetical protein
MTLSLPSSGFKISNDCSKKFLTHPSLDLLQPDGLIY